MVFIYWLHCVVVGCAGEHGSTTTMLQPSARTVSGIAVLTSSIRRLGPTSRPLYSRSGAQLASRRVGIRATYRVTTRAHSLPPSCIHLDTKPMACACAALTSVPSRAAVLFPYVVSVQCNSESRSHRFSIVHGNSPTIQYPPASGIAQDVYACVYVVC